MALKTAKAVSGTTVDFRSLRVKMKTVCRWKDSGLSMGDAFCNVREHSYELGVRDLM